MTSSISENKFNNVFCLVVVSIILSSCSTTGYQTARHNGKLYYIPERCKTYNYNFYSDTIYCRDKGTLTGQTVEPVSEQQAQAYRDQEQKNKEAWAEINQSIKNSTPKTTNCYRTYGGGMNCTTY